jgi:sortase A
MAYVWAGRVCLTLGCLLIAAGVGYGGLLGYMAWQESTSPSTSRVLVLKDGQRIPLVQPTRQPAQPTPTQYTLPSESSQASTSPLTITEAAPSTSVEVLPPLRIEIPAVNVDWPVVLADNDDMPRFKGVGWLIGSAYPGETGNIVLFGHLDGAYSTFDRLKELRPGDQFSIFTETHQYRYVVRENFETTPDDVSVLVPTDRPTATLITCSGRWDPAARNYSRRLIIEADFIDY